MEPYTTLSSQTKNNNICLEISGILSPEYIENVKMSLKSIVNMLLLDGIIFGNLTLSHSENRACG